MAPLTLPQSIDAGTPAVASEVQSNFVAIRDKINGDLEGGSGNNFKANGVTAREIADLMMVRGLPSAGAYQQGVSADGDLRVTPGAGLVLNYASGLVWVTDDSGLIAPGALLPASITADSVTIAANASGNPRIDSLIATLTGYGTATVSVLQGTATAGATLDNARDGSHGAAAVPSDAFLLADILMPNAFAGPFIQTTHIRDRRTWAAGFTYRALVTTTKAQAGSTGLTNAQITIDLSPGVAGSTFPRLETSGGPLWWSIDAFVSNDAAAKSYAFNPNIDLVHPDGQTQPATNVMWGTMITAAAAGAGTYHQYFWNKLGLTPGSHRIGWFFNATNNIANVGGSVTQNSEFVVREGAGLIPLTTGNVGA